MNPFSRKSFSRKSYNRIIGIFGFVPVLISAPVWLMGIVYFTTNYIHEKLIWGKTDTIPADPLLPDSGAAEALMAIWPLGGLAGLMWCWKVRFPEKAAITLAKPIGWILTAISIIALIPISIAAIYSFDIREPLIGTLKTLLFITISFMPYYAVYTAIFKRPATDATL